MEAVIVAAVAAAIWSATSIRIGPLLGFVDRPDDDLKTHEVLAIPLGGVGIFIAVHVGLGIAGRFDGGLLAASAIVLILGLFDDRVGLAPLPRLAVQGVAGALLVLLGDLGVSRSLLSAVWVAVLTVVAINAVNLFDGLDGLAPLSAVLSAVGLGALAGLRGGDSISGLVVGAAFAGFLIFNWHPARVFLGDNGSYVIGFFLTYLIAATATPDLDSGLVVGLATLGVFLVDLAATVVRRRLGGKPMFGGDRSHVYDQLHARGWSVPAVAIGAGMAQAVFVVAALSVELAGIGWLGGLLLLGLGILSLAWLWRAGFLQPADP